MDEAATRFVEVVYRQRSRRLRTPKIVRLLRTMRRLELRRPPCDDCPWGHLPWSEQCAICPFMRGGTVAPVGFLTGQGQALVDLSNALSRLLELRPRPDVNLDAVRIRTDWSDLEDPHGKRLAVLADHWEREGERRHTALQRLCADIRRAEGELRPDPLIGG